MQTCHNTAIKYKMPGTRDLWNYEFNQMWKQADCYGIPEEDWEEFMVKEKGLA